MIVGKAPSGRFADPVAVVTHFHLRAGDRVADFGAGSGNFSIALSKAVGNGGKVYACEIQRNLVERLGKMKLELQLANLEPMWADLEHPGSIKIRDASLTAALLANTLFQIEDKEVALREIARMLEIGGSLFILDWTDSFGGLGPAPGSVVTADVARTLAEANGFRFERKFDGGGHHYGLAFRRV